jgi:hypothetical protein
VRVHLLHHPDLTVTEELRELGRIHLYFEEPPWRTNAETDGDSPDGLSSGRRLGAATGGHRFADSLSQSSPLCPQGRAAGVLNSRECADPTIPLLFID